jgi:hypothetical protein
MWSAAVACYAALPLCDHLQTKFLQMLSSDQVLPNFCSVGAKLGAVQAMNITSP